MHCVLSGIQGFSIIILSACIHKKSALEQFHIISSSHMLRCGGSLTAQVSVMHQTDARGQSLLGTQGTLRRTSMCYCPMTQDVRVGEIVASVSGLGTHGCCSSEKRRVLIVD